MLVTSLLSVLDTCGILLNRSSSSSNCVYMLILNEKLCSSNILAMPKRQLEMSMKGVKCFKCQKTGHMAKNRMESKSKPFLRIVDSLEAK